MDDLYYKKENPRDEMDAASVKNIKDYFDQIYVIGGFDDYTDNSATIRGYLGAIIGRNGSGDVMFDQGEWETFCYLRNGDVFSLSDDNDDKFVFVFALIDCLTKTSFLIFIPLDYFKNRIIDTRQILTTVTGIEYIVFNLIIHF